MLLFVSRQTIENGSLIPLKNINDEAKSKAKKGGLHLQWFRLRSITMNWKCFIASCIKKFKFLLTRNLLFPNPKGRKLSSLVQIWSFPGNLIKAFSIDFGDFCVKKNWNFFASKFLNKQYLKISTVWVAAITLSRCGLYISARVLEIFLEEILIF